MPLDAGRPAGASVVRAAQPTAGTGVNLVGFFHTQLEGQRSQKGLASTRTAKKADGVIARSSNHDGTFGKFQPFDDGSGILGSRFRPPHDFVAELANASGQLGIGKLKHRFHGFGLLLAVGWACVSPLALQGVVFHHEGVFHLL
jgi:hypothetical protein